MIDYLRNKKKFGNVVLPSVKMAAAKKCKRASGTVSTMLGDNPKYHDEQIMRTVIQLQRIENQKFESLAAEYLEALKQADINGQIEMIKRGTGRVVPIDPQQKELFEQLAT